MVQQARIKTQKCGVICRIDTDLDLSEPVRLNGNVERQVGATYVSILGEGSWDSP